MTATPRAIREAVLNDPTATREDMIRADAEADWAEADLNHEGVPETLSMWQYRRYLDAVRTFMELRAKLGESPTKTLGARNGAWAHCLLDRLIDVADDPARCRRQTRYLEEQILKMREAK